MLKFTMKFLCEIFLKISRGWCFGAWGEASEDVHHLVQRLADGRLLVADLQPGRRRPQRSKEAERAALVGQIRRQLAFKAVQQQTKLLLDRLQLLGDGATDAERRRGWAEEVERMAARDERGKHRQCAFARVVL